MGLHAHTHAHARLHRTCLYYSAEFLRTGPRAQARYAAGVREILECFFDKKPIRNEYLVVRDGKLAGVGAHSYSEGNATKGSEEAAKFKHAKK